MKPLDGVVIVEMAGLGPVPFAAMWFADMGATVIRIDRIFPSPMAGVEPAAIRRGRHTVRLDLKADGASDVVLDLATSADVLVEGFRPGVMERLGLGPSECHARNADLVYGRMTGWGQDGPWAGMAGHDIDYIALTGMLHAVGPARQPVPPLNLVGDYGGGAMMLIAGVLAGVTAARAGQGGTVVDAAMVDGSAYLGSTPFALMSEGWWQARRESNLLDGGAPFYRTYETSDFEHMAVGALEPQFYASLIEGLGLADEDLPQQQDVSGWPVLHRRFAEVFASRTRAEWTEVFSNTDACVAPVLSMAEAAAHPHIRYRQVFTDGIPAPAPRFGAEPPTPASEEVESTVEVLSACGFEPDRVADLFRRGVIG